MLGAGAANSTGDIQTTLSQGTVKNAGFRIKGKRASARTGIDDNRHEGSVQFIVASHDVNELESTGYPVFTDSDSCDTSSAIRLVGVNNKANKIIVMKEGEVLQSGTHSELLKSSKEYESLYRKQIVH